MTTLVLDVLRTWQADDADGPPAYRQAWHRALELVAPAWHNVRMTIDGPVLADGGAALALALYLAAAEHGVQPAEVTRPQVEALLEGHELTERWEELLRALGHDPEGADDPVAARWRAIRVDYRPSPGAEPWDDFDASFRRWGPGFADGLRRTLAPRFGPLTF